MIALVRIFLGLLFVVNVSALVVFTAVIRVQHKLSRQDLAVIAVFLVNILANAVLFSNLS
jgi:fumarate reductase subunit D